MDFSLNGKLLLEVNGLSSNVCYIFQGNG